MIDAGMRKILITGVALLALVGSAHANDSMPDALVGHWEENPTGEVVDGFERIEQNVFRYTKNPGFTSYMGYDIEKDKYEIYDYACKVLHVEKQMDTVYTVQSYCKLIGNPDDQLDDSYTDTSEFELLKNGRILVTPVGS
jgi:hypothetical protein